MLIYVGCGAWKCKKCGYETNYANVNDPSCPRCNQTSSADKSKDLKTGSKKTLYEKIDADNSMDDSEKRKTYQSELSNIKAEKEWKDTNAQ